MCDEWGFDEEFMTDVEIDEMIDLTGKLAEEQDSITSVINPNELNQILFTYKTLRYITRGSRAKVSYKLHEPYKSVGYVSVVGDDISFTNPGWFYKISECASNIEVYPRTDGKIQINFTFHGLTLPIE